MSDPVIVALIGGGVSLLLGWLEFVRRQNKSDHDRGYTLMQSIDTRLMRVDEKLDEHIADRSLHPTQERIL